jgi:hypothetical protein
VSFLNQLKSQASALQTQQAVQQQNLEENTRLTELACQTTAYYLADLAKQLGVIQPAGPNLSLDGRKPWPAMRLVDFRVDVRKKKLRDREVYDYMAMAWQIVPQSGAMPNGSVSVNFPPDLERVEKRLACGGVQFERKDIRHPESNKLQEVRFDFQIQARGYLTVTADHDAAQLHFRLANASGFDIQTVSWDAARVRTELLDELAKLLVGQPSRFL